MKIEEYLSSKNKSEIILMGGSLTKVIDADKVIIKLYQGPHERGYEKLANEIKYLENIPIHIEKYFPKVIEKLEDSNFIAYSLHKYNLQSITELVLNNLFPIGQIANHVNYILEKLNQDFYSHYFNYNQNIYFEQFYINRWRNIDHFFRVNYTNIYTLDVIDLNGCELKNLRFYIDRLCDDNELKELLVPNQLSYFHGNFHLANILSDLNNFILIDPRGELLGDKYYDYSKYYSHLVTSYDQIHFDQFKFQKDNNRYRIGLLNKIHNLNNRVLLKSYLEYLSTKNIDLNKIALMSALNVLSFATYHARKERINKQRVLSYYMSGLKILNDYFDNKFNNSPILELLK